MSFPSSFVVPSATLGSSLRAATDKKVDRISKLSRMSMMTTSTRITVSSGTPSRSARYFYLSSVLGRASAVLRPHPRNMVESLKQLAEEAICTQCVKKALIKHVNEIEKLVMSNRKAGAMMNKSMMHWRMFLKSKNFNDDEVVWMIQDVNSKMDRIKFKLNLAEDSVLANQYITARLFECYIDDGLRIIVFDTNNTIKHYIDAAKAMRKSLRKLQKKVFSSDYFDNVKDWVMDAVVKCYVIMAIDTVSALKLQPIIIGLVRNVKDGNLIETQFVNRLRCFNVSIHQALIEAKLRRCHTMYPMDDVLAKMAYLDQIVKYGDAFDKTEQMENLKLLDQIIERTEPKNTEFSKEKIDKHPPCEPVVLRNEYGNMFPQDLFPPFI